MVLVESQNILLTDKNVKSNVLKRFGVAFRRLHSNFWYSLRIAVLVVVKMFECEKCGRCCMYSPPIFKESEAVEIARFLGVEVEELPLTEFVQFSRRYYRAPKPCPFLGDDMKCRVYSVRGAGCRAFPHEWLMYAMVPEYCPSVFRAIEKATLFIEENNEALKKAVVFMQDDLDRLARESAFKEKMRYEEYDSLVRKLFRFLKSI